MPHTNILEADLAALVVIDVQEKMLATIQSSQPEQIIDRMLRLIGTADLLGLPILWTEQYPKGLGPTDGRLRDRLGPGRSPIVKSMCSCWRDDAFKRAIEQTHREQIILAGLETHVCIQQTALDLLRVDYGVFVAADAVGSRRLTDMQTALERMRCAGVEVSTSESLMFELIERCDHPKFRDFLKLVK